MTGLWFLRGLCLVLGLLTWVVLGQALLAQVVILPAEVTLKRFAAGAGPDDLMLAEAEAALTAVSADAPRAEALSARALVAVLDRAATVDAAIDVKASLTLAPEEPVHWLRAALTMVEAGPDPSSGHFDDVVAQLLTMLPEGSDHHWSTILVGLAGWEALAPARRLAVADALRSRGSTGLAAIAPFFATPDKLRRLRRIYRDDAKALALLAPPPSDAPMAAPIAQQVR